MTNQKKSPSLPADVAKKYDCVIVPTVVMISKGEAKGSYDLTKISVADADKLAKAGKFLKPKESPTKTEK